MNCCPPELHKAQRTASLLTLDGQFTSILSPLSPGSIMATMSCFTEPLRSFVEHVASPAIEKGLHYLLAYADREAYMRRGTNVCILRFFDDRAHGNMLWGERWVRDWEVTDINNWETILTRTDY